MRILRVKEGQYRLYMRTSYIYNYKIYIRGEDQKEDQKENQKEEGIQSHYMAGRRGRRRREEEDIMTNNNNNNNNNNNK